MELDHTKLGHNCDVPACNQRDFLPFTCDLCRRKLCLLHRSYTSHSCEGCNSKDMTSIDCPICMKSVKFTQSQSADVVWQDHYMNSCSREFSVAIAAKTCSKSSCTTILGLSNSFKCPKCGKEVCLSHRVPEEHDCPFSSGNQRAKPNSSFLDRIALTKSQSKDVQSNSNTGKSSASKLDSSGPDNSLRGTADRRIRAAKNSSVSSSSASHAAGHASGDQFSCPLCSFLTLDAVELQTHFTASHPDMSSAPSNKSSRGGVPQEVCS
jgi:AN1-type zinc finger protein 2